MAFHSNVHQAYLLHVLPMLIKLVALMIGKVLVVIVADVKTMPHIQMFPNQIHMMKMKNKIAEVS